MTSQTVCTFVCELDPESRVMVIYLAGKLDPLATEELTPEVDKAYQTGVRRFVFDLSRLEYVGSLGLRLFVGLHNRVRGQGAVALSSVSPGVLTILNMTKLNQILRFYPTRHEAIDAIRG